jgi:hypothetical protein
MLGTSDHLIVDLDIVLAYTTHSLDTDTYKLELNDETKQVDVRFH